ncbi:ubiquitin carboxyl-terminal hydrolase-like protein 22 [Lepidopterella palustris CBS 459.81]|uniref:Ubiquitin carboxyl-terminal hydrolase n=1 Tax=Lepidopterella palustris CBS 459.81 TaxID=1314670 RepID=A0A8E2JK35_9PEZI|nr:ubiquitin carboxyl-terminal hydrolase-like protein 22 [Lepidopterella palustris CBS 459.81]
MDTITVTPKTATALASPKVTKNPKTNMGGPSVVPHVSFGCEHIRELFEKVKKMATTNYTQLLHTIHEKPSIIVQTHRSTVNGDGRSVVSLRPLYLCLQCPNVMTEEIRDRHFDAKGHAFSVESREGYLYCRGCNDYVYDPTLENIRLQKGKKRKHDEINNAEDQKLIAQNSTFVPCRAIGLRGLYNMGQTCFMSVILQTLIHNPFIRNFYLAEGHKPADCEKEACVSCAMDEIFIEFHSVEKTEGFGAVSMLLGSWMAAQALAGYQQQDAHEYMQFILNALHAENGGSTSDSNSSDCNCVIHKTFYGKLQSTVTCDKCRNVTTALDPVMDLSLDLRSQAKKRKLDAETSKDAAIDLRDCLERFTSREKLAAAEYTCHNCDGTQQNATKQLSIKRLPPVLPIHLKRFEHSKSSSSKLETKIRFPLQLDLYPYTTRCKTRHPNAKSSSNLPNTNQNINSPANSLIYELSSVVVHKGKIDSGHYVSYSREGRDWFMFDDSKVVLVSEAEVLDANAYLLFYMSESLEV